MKKFVLIFMFVLMPLMVSAKDITDVSTYKINDTIASKLKDNNENSYLSISKGSTISITSEEDIYGIYIIYELSSQTGNININNKNINIGVNNFLHEYIDLKENKSKELTITYDNDVKIGEIYVIGEGEIPEYVEIWETPCEKADVLLFSTHSDDEQLFFLGLLPTYVARGAYTQVVYFTNHFDNPKRLHEQLHGLYTVGIRNYPIIGIVPDAYSESLNGALNNLKKANLTEEDALNFEVENIRRFKPQVVVGHDEKGEYSHGQHILNTYILEQAIEKANDSAFHPESYNKYGNWNVPKTYLHLYKENQITMNYDIPLDYFNGKTAYEVSKEGYSKHNSQQWTWFTGWINGKNNEYTKATDIKTYSPLEFGLYRSLVGEDVNKNDMLENITLYKDQVKEEENKDKNTINKKEDKTNKKDIKYYIEKYKDYLLPVGLILISIILLLIILRRKK